MSDYSPRRRTALVLSGTGAHGAYHAGVLQAFHESGVKIDVVAGRGVGAAAAALAIVTTEGRVVTMRLLLTTTLLPAMALWWLR